MGKIIQAGGALILQEIGHFIGTILLGLPLAIMLGMGREAVGATYSIGREPNIAIIEAKYGLSSPEGRGVMAMYICGTLYGAVWMGIIASVIAGLDIMSPRFSNGSRGRKWLDASCVSRTIIGALS